LADKMHKAGWYVLLIKFTMLHLRATNVEIK
jgi:hypothetical protein